MSITVGKGGGVEVEGIDELRRALLKSAESMTDEDMERSILGIGKEMVAKMRHRAHPSIRYAIVAKSFSRRAVGRAAAFVAVDRGIKDSKNRAVGRLAEIMEFGTVPRYRKKQRGKRGGLRRLLATITGRAGYTGMMPARPFFRPVVDEYKGDVFLRKLKAVVAKRIERTQKNKFASSGKLLDNLSGD